MREQRDDSAGGRIMRRSSPLLVVVAALLVGPCLAQERPVFQPFRIGYAHTGTIGDRLRSDDALQRELRRAGLMVTWRSFNDGRAVVRALHDDEIDVALDMPQPDAMRSEAAGPVKSSPAPAIDDPPSDTADNHGHRYVLTNEETVDKARNALLSVMRAVRRTTSGGGDNGARPGFAMIVPGSSQANPAHARAETWLCTPAEYPFDDQFVIMALNGEVIVEQLSELTQYRVLENNRYALIAEHHTSDFDALLDRIVITASMVTIDKTSSRFTYTTAVSGNAVQQRGGLCRGFG